MAGSGRWRCVELADEQLGCRADRCCRSSTGADSGAAAVLKINRALPQRQPANWADAAEAIMTTDIQPKTRRASWFWAAKPVTLTGIAKGSGMIHPNMATMLGFVATDAVIAPELLQGLLSQVADLSL